MASIDPSCELLGDFFTIFAHASRMKILCALQGGPKTVTEIASHTELAIPNVSQHLRLMRDKRAVKAEKQAQKVYYQMADPRIVQAMRLIGEALKDRLHHEVAQGEDPPQPNRQRRNAQA